jgi:hypothetical protein
MSTPRELNEETMRDERTNRNVTADAATPEECGRPWESMRLRYVGHISEILRQGGGKLTATAGDPGEGRKQTGGGG